MAFNEGQKVHLYIKGHDLFEGTITKVGKGKTGECCTVSYDQGTLVDLDLDKMYPGTNNDPHFVSHNDLKGVGDEVTV